MICPRVGRSLCKGSFYFQIVFSEAQITVKKIMPLVSPCGEGGEKAFGCPSWRPWERERLCSGGTALGPLGLFAFSSSRDSG